MNLKSRLYISLVLLISSLSVNALTIRVGLFNDYSVSKLVLTINQGSYDILLDSTYLYELKQSDILYLTFIDDKINISTIRKSIGSYSKINLITNDTSGYFSIKPVYPDLDTRSYDDNCNFIADINRITIINIIDLEKYIAGVVEAEGGIKAESEYYKTQAILCRTYALNNLYKFVYEGFNLCDGVSCQAYHGRSYNKKIIDATLKTKNLVLMDGDSNLISAAYHSNSGGQTQNSEDVWLAEKPYLKSIDDPFSVDQRNYRWRKTISLSDWREYLSKYGLKEAYQLQPSAFVFYQNLRKKYYNIGEFQLELKTVRQDWKLKSTFFSIHTTQEKIVMQGKGYGHGVGLSQEGAMNMAKQGYNYKGIIDFYFQEVHIINYSYISNLSI